ncbi:hypothetical protein GMOD_00004959 [Pyrenophora seminiperda CCB06]|uniref:Uncharacterized protein n=1 Tax=Pyrenophora seminiperda CCB06 TaxID=1302712 RepID=A0A3M7MHW2_9PLEO|nr:hypothetical protein GMOD_00004959 [Pyrenophora seminiperda CCB06]
MKIKSPISMEVLVLNILSHWLLQLHFAISKLKYTSFHAWILQSRYYHALILSFAALRVHSFASVM